MRFKRWRCIARGYGVALRHLVSLASGAEEVERLQGEYDQARREVPTLHYPVLHAQVEFSTDRGATGGSLENVTREGPRIQRGIRVLHHIRDVLEPERRQKLAQLRALESETGKQTVSESDTDAPVGMSELDRLIRVARTTLRKVRRSQELDAVSSARQRLEQLRDDLLERLRVP